MIGGAVLIDLRDIDPKVAYRRLGQLGVTPTGARLVLVVGPLVPNLRVVDLLREHTARLDVDVWGTADAVPQWIVALRTGDVAGVLL